MKQPLTWFFRTPTLLAAVLALLLSTGLHATTVPTPKVLAVLMYADWCASCKVLDPKLQAVRPEFEQSDILFLRFDFTDEGTTFQSGMLAQTLGLAELYERNGGRTGYMVLVDRTSGEVMAMIRAQNSEAEIRQMLRAAAAGT